MNVELLNKVQKYEAIICFYDDTKKPLSVWKDPVVTDYLKMPLDTDFSGKSGETHVIYLNSHPVTKRVILVGVGNRKKLSLQRLRTLSAQATHAAQKIKLSKKVGMLLPKEPKLKAAEVAEALVLGSKVYQFRYEEFKSKKSSTPIIDATLIVQDAKDAAAAKKGVERGTAIGEGVNFGRELIVMSPRQLYPAEFAKRAVDMAKKSSSKAKIKTTVWTEAELKKNKYGGILCVGQGSDNPPRFVVLEYKNAAASKAPVVLVGKGITFDSGGLSLKPPPMQETMKYDMAGAASVLSAFKIVAELKLKVNLVCILCLAENMPSGKAQRPGDVVTMASGLSVEVLNTDAEGRLVLADGLFHASTKYKPKAIVNVATLTGACAAIVGDAAAGLYSNDKKLTQAIEKSAESTGEHVWEFPNFQDFYSDLLDSEVADLRNIGKGRVAGATVAGMFLERFVENKASWAHLDIAGCGWYDAPRDFISGRGPSGVPIRLLAELVESYG